MTREEEIFEKALDFESDIERRAYLAGACAGDEALAQAVADLLAAHSSAERGEFLAGLQKHEALIWEREGSIVGRYKLLQKIGEGGFGVVYMAEQREPVKRRVALKIIKLGMDTKQVVGRFEAERQALAMLAHPNIANVLDAGATENGRPYFVMELVRGVPVTDFCDQHQLTTEERLKLFLDICAAVQHAHQRGLIHRDLKPGNILVAMNDNNRPHPKVIDFGIAKATQQELTDKTLFTRFEDFVGTPAYMSPEQANYRQLDVDTRTDVYSLGVLLYELVTGRTPFDSAELAHREIDEIRRRICEDDPPRPSTRLDSLEMADRTTIATFRKVNPERLQRTLRREIDWIIMMAMEKDRSRRYGSAEALARDIEHYLEGEAVAACPPSALYRIRKSAGKHRAAVAVVGVIVASLGVVSVVSFVQAVRVSRAHAEGRELLRNSYLVQAEAMRKNPEPGRHFRSLEAIAKAAEIRPSVRLRNEAIAAMAMPDLRFRQRFGTDRPPGAVAAIDRQGERYAFAYPDGAVTFYRIEDGEEIGALPNQEGEPLEILFSEDGDRLAVQTRTPAGERLSVWSIAESRLELEVPDVWWGSLAFAPNGRQVAVGVRGPNQIVVYDLPTGEVRARLPFDLAPGKLRFDPAGERLAVLASVTRNMTETLTVFPLSAPSNRLEFRVPLGAMGVGWHPEGEILGIGSADFNVYLWRLESQAPTRVLRGHQAEVTSVKFHPGGRFLATAAWDGTTRVWDSHRGQLYLTTADAVDGFLADGRGLSFRMDSSGGGDLGVLGRVGMLLAVSIGRRGRAQAELPGVFLKRRLALGFGQDLALVGSADGA